MSHSESDKRHFAHENERVQSVTDNGFVVKRLGQDEARFWQDELIARVSPELSWLSFIGLSAVNASLHELTDGNREKMDVIHRTSLFADPNDIVVNNALTNGTGIFGGRKAELRKLFKQGSALIAVAQAATLLQDKVSPDELLGRGSGGVFKEMTYDINPFPEEAQSLRLTIGTDAVGTIGFNYAQYEGPDGRFSAPHSIKLGARLLTHFPESVYATIDLTAGFRVGAQVTTGKITKEIFAAPIYGAPADISFTQLADFAKVMNSVSRRFPKF